MPVSIEDVLKLLPVIFPGKQPIPRKNLRRNPDNPGKPTEQEIKDQADDMAERGLQNPIQVGPDRANPLANGAQLHPDDPRLRGDGKPWELGDFNYLIYGGELRDRAAELLQWESIDGFIHNPNPEEAADLLYWDNKVRDRGWWGDYLHIELLIKANPNLTQRQIADKRKMDEEKVNRAIKLLPLLNSEARELIARTASNSNPELTSIARITSNSNKGNKGISEIAAAQLAGLGPGTGLKPGVKKKVGIPAPDTPIEPGQASHGLRLEASAQLEPQKLWPYPVIPPETQDLVRRALAVAIEHKMTEAKVKAFVAWIKEGHQPEDYGKAALNAPTPAQGGLHKVLTAVAGHLTKAASDLGTVKAQGKAKASSKGGVKGKGGSKAKASKSLWLRFLKWVGSQLLKGLEWLVKLPYRMLEKGIRLCAEGKWVNGLIQLAFTFLVFWAILWAWHHPGRMLGWGEGFVGRLFSPWTHSESAASKVDQASQKTPLSDLSLAPKQQAEVRGLVVPGQKVIRPRDKKPLTPVSNTPVQVYLPSHAWQASDETIEMLEAEIAPIPLPSTVKDFPVTPDEGINPDMAGRRTGDMQDSEKYSLKVGKDTQKILTLMPNMSSLVLTFQGDNPFGLPLGGPSKIEFYWEEVRAIHTCQIEVLSGTPHPIYQLSLVVSSLKVPLVFQCATAEDCQHLLSALEFWIRNARAGKNAPVSGLPYLNQGVLLGDGGRVEGEWQNSPVEKSNLLPGDHVWGVDQNPQMAQSPKALEGVLQNLAPGNHVLFVVDPGEWDKVETNWHTRGAKPYNPKVVKMAISIPVQNSP